MPAHAGSISSGFALNGVPHIAAETGLLVPDPLNLIRIMPAEGLRADIHSRECPILHPTAHGGTMKKTLTALVSLLTLAAPAMAKETLTVYTYDSFVAEWGPGDSP